MGERDRMVHAVCEDGREVVRYDRAGKWYIETPGGKRRAVSVSEAVAIAAETYRGAGAVYLGKPGGGLFDARVKALLSDAGGRVEP